MAEERIVTCDDCGKQAVETLLIRYDGKGVSKDVCRTHLDRIISGGRRPSRGRRRGAYAA